MFPRLSQPRKSGLFGTGSMAPAGWDRKPFKGKRRWARRCGYGLLLVLAVSLMVLALALQHEPLVLPPPAPSQQYLSRARDLIHGTVQAAPVQANRKDLVLTAEDLTAAANFLLLRKRLEGRAACTIDNGRLKMQASLRLPLAWMPLFLNLRLIVDDAEPQAVVKRVKLGRLSLPAPIVGWLANATVQVTPLSRYGRVGERLVREVRIRDGRLVVSLNWNRDLLNQAQGLVTDLADKERLVVYHDKLAEIVGQPNVKRFVRLDGLLQSLFALARSRSGKDGDPVAENRALILVLAAYVNGKDLAAALPSRSNPARRGVLLNKRIDTAQHFMGSAALALAGQGTLVDMVGLAKEMNDTHDGSGFSFTDLAADQAGALFGKAAAHSAEKARNVQDLLAGSANESLYMPYIKDLPENLNPEEFRTRFEDIDSPRFHAMKTEIETRILALPLYRPR